MYVYTHTLIAIINYSWGAWKQCCRWKDLFMSRNFINCGSVSCLFSKDDCLTSLTRFAAAHWTVSSLSAVQGHFCTLLACKFNTLCCFSQRWRYRKLLNKMIVSCRLIRRLFCVEVLSNGLRTDIFTSMPVDITSYCRKGGFSFNLQLQDTFLIKAWIFCYEGVLLISSEPLYCCF